MLLSQDDHNLLHAPVIASGARRQSWASYLVFYHPPSEQKREVEAGETRLADTPLTMLQFRLGTLHGIASLDGGDSGLEGGMRRFRGCGRRQGPNHGPAGPAQR